LTVNNKLSKWSVGRGPSGLSINTACNLLAACVDDNKIQEYSTSNGSLVREIRLKSNDSELLRPYHVIQWASGQFVTSCLDVNSRAFDVVAADINGRVVVSYKNQLQLTGEPIFSAPCHLAVDKSNECILVADCGNNRIVILNRSSNGCAREFNVASVDGGLQRPSIHVFLSTSHKVD
jgi:DNA-binding beta-propeller fold protein YncE